MPAGARAFTLTEMLVVIGMMVLILGIATPMITRAWRAGDRTRTAADLAAIASALEAYRQDHGSYPRVKGPPWKNAPAPVSTEWLGARMLCRALIGPGPGIAANAEEIADGAGAVKPGDPSTAPENERGPGFRTRKTPGPDGLIDTVDDVPQGRVYGPYLKPESFKLGDPEAPTSSTARPGRWAILDRYNRPILYFPASPAKPNVGLMGQPGSVPGFVHTDTGDASEMSFYDADDNLNAFRRAPGDNANALRRLRIMLGDRNANGLIDGTAGETAATNAPFLLWSAGPDELYGPDASTASPTGTLDFKDADKCDDVTHFQQ